MPLTILKPYKAEHGGCGEKTKNNDNLYNFFTLQIRVFIEREYTIAEAEN